MRISGYINCISMPGRLISFILLTLSALPAVAQEAYKIGSEDVLEVRFWQDISLNATVRVTQEGTIALDIVGEIQAAGLTTSELERSIVRQMTRYNKDISQAVVRVVEYNHLKVFVSGQVQNPGKYTFEVIPDLWTIINEAGGITELGDLSRVMLIQSSGRVEIVNVSALLSSGNLGELPKVESGETIEVPRTASGLPSMPLTESIERKNIYYVMGETNDPGALNYERNLDVLDAIALAGGPTERADIGGTRIISKVGYQTKVTKINLKNYAENAMGNRYIIQPEDVVYVPQGSGGFLGLGVTEWVAAIGGIASFLIVAGQLNLLGLGTD
jgi:polysaccharide export outer membrane protein